MVASAADRRRTGIRAARGLIEPAAPGRLRGRPRVAINRSTPAGIRESSTVSTRPSSVGIVAEPRSQAGDMKVDERVLVGEPATPDSLEQRRAGDHDTGLAGQRGEDVEFDGGQVDGDAIDPDIPSQEVDLDRRRRGQGSSSDGTRGRCSSGRGGLGTVGMTQGWAVPDGRRLSRRSAFGRAVRPDLRATQTTNSRTLPADRGDAGQPSAGAGPGIPGG